MPVVLFYSRFKRQVFRLVFYMLYRFYKVERPRKNYPILIVKLNMQVEAFTGTFIVFAVHNFKVKNYYLSVQQAFDTYLVAVEPFGCRRYA